MFVRFAMAAAVLVAVAVVVCVLVRRERRLRAVLVRERAASRLTAGQMCRDLEAFRRRVGVLVAERAVLAEADRVLADALAEHAGSNVNGEGGQG